MKFLAVADTDIGISKSTNQDSVLIKHAKSPVGEVLMAVICDGLGGLSKGELASATVARAFSKWFDEELPIALEQVDMNALGETWSSMLKALNAEIAAYGRQRNSRLGTTFSGILFVGNQYVIAHVGDSRVYHIDTEITQLTSDQTFVAREVAKGTMTLDQAKTDNRRNLLLQCVGASQMVVPQVLIGNTQRGAYLLCSDGFRHEISEQEIYESLQPVNLTNKETMKANISYLIELVKTRQERDNISSMLIKISGGERDA